MEVKLDDYEMLTILHALQVLHNQNKEFKDLLYDNIQDFLLDINKIRMLHNKLLIQSRNEGVLKREVNLI